MFSKVAKILKETPAFLLLIFVFLFILPRSFSYDHAWVQPEQFYFKLGILSSGPNLNLQDLKNGLNWPLFEYQPRCTRPLASYFEILDTKFRVWLWHYMPPLPSLSLSWIFSLILAPIFLYKLLRNIGISVNVAIAMVSFYLVTPGVLSYEVMLYRSGKPMADFFIIFCLYMASVFKRKFIDRNEKIPFRCYIGFWSVAALSFYWDETSWIIFPAMFFIFPRVIKPKFYLLLWLLLPLITLISYFKIIPYLSLWAGFAFPQFGQSLKFYNGLAYADVMNKHFGPICYFIKVLGPNTKNLILETMGVIVPDLAKNSAYIIASFCNCLFAWGVISYYLCKARKKWDPILPLLFGLVLFFNYWISLNLRIWGPYCYGTFWSIFFVIYLSRFIDKADIPKKILTACLFFIILNMFNCFLATNLIYKKYHYYPYSPGLIRDYYFAGPKSRFNESPAFTGDELRLAIYNYWCKVRKGRTIKPFLLPRELCWLPVELEPTITHERHSLLVTDNRNYLPAN